MNSTLFLMLGLGGAMPAEQLHAMIAATNEKRRHLFMKIADILFGLYMFFFADLDVEVVKDGVARKLDDKSLTQIDKMNGIITLLTTADKGTRFRELVRPLLISAAEVIADLMAPDESLIALLARPAAPAPGTPAPPQRAGRY